MKIRNPIIKCARKPNIYKSHSFLDTIWFLKEKSVFRDRNASGPGGLPFPRLPCTSFRKGASPRTYAPASIKHEDLVVFFLFGKCGNWQERVFCSNDFYKEDISCLLNREVCWLTESSLVSQLASSSRQVENTLLDSNFGASSGDSHDAPVPRKLAGGWRALVPAETSQRLTSPTWDGVDVASQGICALIVF